MIEAALGDARTVINVGAGTGSYEPSSREVIALEPSDVMIRQRAKDAAPCIRGLAEALPFQSDSADAAMAILSVHHWPNLERGLIEMARVARKRVVLLTWVPDARPFWLTTDYFPEIAEHDARIFPNSERLSALMHELVGPAQLTPVPVPHDCIDGFLCAYWRRPEAYLRPEVRASISSFACIQAEGGLEKLRTDLHSGEWTARNAHLLSLDELDLGYRLVCCEVRK